MVPQPNGHGYSRRRPLFGKSFQWGHNPTVMDTCPWEPDTETAGTGADGSIMDAEVSMGPQPNGHGYSARWMHTEAYFPSDERNGGDPAGWRAFQWGHNPTVMDTLKQTLS